ncbi:MAG TPA: PP2C family protein-serine/threonine phosphatase, partial [Actinopolymorphaceae bacterium]
GDASAGAVREIGETAHALGYIVIANQRFTDLYEWGQRSTPLTLAAEIQHQLLPNALTCEADQFTLAGSLEPAHQVGGDTFDYAFDRETLHLSLTDAMGSGVRSALAATLLVGALRGARRAGADLVEQARRADLALTEHEHDHATGLLMRVELRTGRVDVVNAGHVLPLRLRNGRVEELWLEPNMPFGIPFPHTYTVQHVDLQPGDRLMLLTDGVLERSGLDVATLIGRAHRLHPREAARYLTLEVIRAHQGNLRDDATVLCLDWYGVERPARTASGGASQDLASPAVRDEHRA